MTSFLEKKNIKNAILITSVLVLIISISIYFLIIQPNQNKKIDPSTRSNDEITSITERFPQNNKVTYLDPKSPFISSDDFTSTNSSGIIELSQLISFLKSDLNFTPRDVEQTLGTPNSYFYESLKSTPQPYFYKYRLADGREIQLYIQPYAVKELKPTVRIIDSFGEQSIPLKDSEKIYKLSDFLLDNIIQVSDLPVEGQFFYLLKTENKHPKDYYFNTYSLRSESDAIGFPFYLGYNIEDGKKILFRFEDKNPENSSSQKQLIEILLLNNDAATKLK